MNVGPDPISLTPRTLTWDAKGRMKTVLQNSSTETYRYDPNNYRIGRLGGMLGTLDYYLEGEHLESVVQAGTVVEKYFRGSSVDELVAGFEMQNGEFVPTMYQHDQVNSVVAESNVTGGTQASFTYTSFGQTQAISGTQASRLKFTGREDDGNGLYYYRARYYDPVVGRFISEDPKKFAAGINFYTYVNNNPINANDPSGLASVLDFLAKGIKVVNQYIETHPITGIPFKSGFPDFTEVAIKDVKVANLTGTAKDFDLANQAAGLAETPAGYTWHHVEDGTTMQLVPSDIHSATGHTGGAAWLKAGGAAAGVAAAGNADASDSGILGSGVTWGDVKSFVVDTLTDPSTYYAPLMLLKSSGLGGCTDGVCSDMVHPQGSTDAAGGFLIYPNKPNSNQAQSVYSK